MTTDVLASRRYRVAQGRPSPQLRAATGTHCPRSGFWAPAGCSSDSIRIFEGSLMPTHDGNPVTWHLVTASRR